MKGFCLGDEREEVVLVWICRNIMKMKRIIVIGGTRTWGEVFVFIGVVLIWYGLV
ncbi:hypothetical protein MtrunA17_Chr3g0112061 [Medicago truncatula]|uniref:Transmembrane protein n=1 Tax=Medicago truncatula TaxID=3880 RepID=A0A396IUF7_MEDTR|nr:hypothetical protein MtrunA17_Chr3g0112061 [Medicago truncatula]